MDACMYTQTDRQTDRPDRQTDLSFPGPFEPVRGDKHPFALERIVPHVRMFRGTKDSRQRLRI